MSEAVVHPYSPDFRVSLDRDLLKALAKPVPLRLLLQTGMEWLWIVVLIVAASQLSSIALSMACMVLIASRQHALLTLMHEYSHYQLSRKHAWLNDLVGDAFTAFPFLITIHGFRRNHTVHHRHVSTDQDPDWIATMKKDRYQFPKSRRQIFTEILKHCLGWYTLQDMKGYTIGSGMATNLPRAVRISSAVYALTLAAVVTYFDLWWIVLLYWVVPMATFLMGILYLRDMGEHFGMPSPGISGSRTVLSGWVERLLICQNGVNFHTEHHLFPSVPFFRLKRLHQALMKDGHYRANALITRGYLSGLLDEASVATGKSVAPQKIA